MSSVKKIFLSRGLETIVDEADYESLSKYKWYARKGHSGNYAVRAIYIKGKQKILRMHRVITNCPPGLVPDHIDGNTLNNLRSNLRIATHGQNRCAGKRPCHAISPYRGTTKDKRHKNCSWKALIGKTPLGSFETVEEAAKAYDREARKRYGEFASLNFPQEVLH